MIMSIKLELLTLWTPKFILLRELERTATLTNEHLDGLIINSGGSPPCTNKLNKGNLQDRQAVMAKGHNLRIKILIDILGKEKAFTLAKKEMFKAGFELGQTARELLNVGDNVEDTIKAAKILYKVLGIVFFTEKNGNNIIMWVKSCELAQYYSPDTCMIMSYADKGVLKGLNKNMELKFTERITTGSNRCKACININ